MMNVIAADQAGATVALTRRELIILANAINEAQEAVEGWEFAARMGAAPEEAERLRLGIKDLLKNGAPGPST